MPGIHSPLARHLITIDGAVKTAGGTKNLAQGQFALVQKDKPTADGATVLNPTLIQALSPNAQLEMRLGNFAFQNPTNVYNNKAKTSETFKIGSIASIKTYSPKVTEQEFDAWILGYDGINANSALNIPEGSYSVVDIVFCGDALEYATGSKEHLAKFHISREEGQSMDEVVRELYSNIVNYTFQGNIPLTALASVKLVDSNAEVLTGEEYVFATLTVADQGEAADLARVQAQYEYKVVRKDRQGLNSIYSVMRPEGEALAGYERRVAGAFLKGCEDCPVGYDLIEGGVIYSVALEDDGASSVALVQGLPGAIAGSAVKIGNSNGKGTYTVVLDNELTNAEITTFVNAGTVQKTSEIQLVGDVADLCNNPDTETFAWVDGDSCFASTQNYQIQLRDNNCGENRLAELQEAYPELTISLVATANATRTLTLTGTSGTANVAIGGNTYLATFATSLPVTATNFVATHGANLASDNIQVTANGAVLTFRGLNADVTGLAITNATTNLAGTLGTVTAVPTVGGCQTVYQTTVATDVICEDCDPIFTELFKSDAPNAFDGIEWTLVEAEATVGGFLGIKIEAKPITIKPTDVARDYIPRYETSVGIMIAGGYAEDINLSTFVNYEPFKVKQLSWRVDRDNLGWHLLGYEDASRAYFDGLHRHKENMFARTVLGEESVLKFDSQYLSYEITIMDRRFSQGVGHTSNIGTSYLVWVEVGFQDEIETLLNALAAKVGIPVEKAFAE